jgi:uncharacterized protein
MPDAMCVSELDGFIAGLLLCPDVVQPSEWLPVVWGLVDEPKLESLEQVQATVAAVISHYDRVALTLRDGFEPYQMVVDYPDLYGEPIWEFWIAGFVRAMKLRPNAWDAYKQSNFVTVKAAFAVMVSLIDIGGGESTLDEELREKFEHQIVATIPELVVRMSRLIKAPPLALTGS